MTKILLGLLVAISIYASEPIQYGAYYGDIKEKMTNISSYPENDVASAGTIYLYKQKKNTVDYIYETKIKHLTDALSAAKNYAIKNKSKYYAVDNVTHQVVITKNSITIMTNYNVLSFD